MRDALIDYLVNAAWQLPLLAVGAGLLSHVASLSARARCWLWSAFLALALILPLQLHPAAALSLAAPSVPAPAPLIGAHQAIVAGGASVTPEAPVFSIGPRLGEAILALFAAALLIGAARLALGLAAARRLVRRARPMILPAGVAEALETFAKSHGIETPQVLACADIASPVTVGVLAPVILAPADFGQCTGEQAKAAILHEAAHICRGDYAANLICEAAALPLVWHPAIYPLKAGVRHAREVACDQLASSAMRSPEAYARCLVALARAAITPLGRPAAPALALIGSGALEARVKYVLTNRPRGPLAMLRTALAAVLVLAGVVVPALLLHVTPSFAEERSVAVTPPTAPAPLPPPASVAEPSAADGPLAVVTPGHPHPTLIVDGKAAHGYPHSWTARNGKTMTVITDSDRPLTAAEQAKIEAELANARQQIEHARGEIERATREANVTVQLSAKDVEAAQKAAMAAQREVARIDVAKISAEAAKAAAVLNDPRIRAQIERATKVLADGKVQRSLNDAADAIEHPENHPGVIIWRDDADAPPSPK